MYTRNWIAILSWERYYKFVIYDISWTVCATQWHAAESCVWRTWASRFINSATPSCVIDQITKAVGTLYTSWKSRLTTRLLKHRGWDKMATILQTISSNWFSCTKIAFWFKFHRDIPYSKKQHWFRWLLAAEHASSRHMNQLWSILLMHMYVTQPRLVSGHVQIHEKTNFVKLYNFGSVEN